MLGNRQRVFSRASILSFEFFLSGLKGFPNLVFNLEDVRSIVVRHARRFHPRRQGHAKLSDRGGGVGAGGSTRRRCPGGRQRGRRLGDEAGSRNGRDARAPLRTMGNGVHASTAGSGAAIFWQPTGMAQGNYTISASFTQTEPSGHANAYGLFFGGSDLSGPNQRYSYFVLRQGGEFLVKKRMGAETPTLVGWTAHDAISDLDDQGRSSNTLAVEVGSSRCAFW